jgi:hypothetical protein
MEIKDKRLVDRMDTGEQKRYLQGISKQIPDASDKFDELEIQHEPIQLLQKLKDRITDRPDDPFSLEAIEQSDET